MKKNQKFNIIARSTVACSALVGLFACAGSSSPSANAAGVSGQGDKITVAVNFVNYTKNGKAVLSKDEVNNVIARANKLYAQCNMALTLDEYKTVDPADFGLDYNTGSLEDMDKVRAPFETDKALVVTNTGSWDHGNMGAANAWTAMPGQTPAGAVLEAPVADNANIVAHELGHYLNLDHVSDQSNLMNPIIYDDSTTLDQGQCEEVRKTAQNVWTKALR